MAFPKRHHFRRKHRPDKSGNNSEIRDLMQPDHTGSESSYLKSLVDSRAKVTVVLTNGEQLRGHIRYYDRHCFSIGLSAQGPRIFLRKDSVSYICEE